MKNATLRNRYAAAVTALCLAAPLALFGCGGAPASSQSDSSQSTEQSGSSQGADTGQNASSSSDSGVKTAMSEDGRLDLLTLVNKEYALPDGWEEKLDLVKVDNSKGETVQIDKIAAKAFEELQEDLRKNEGITIELNSGYRSVDEQKRIWDQFMQEYGEDYVREFVAKPGHSEHHTGIALDAFLIENGIPILTNEEIFAHESTWKIIHSYLPKHGFILRYLNGQEDITGYTYEPWHYRYVGEQAAKEIMDKGITLEEYLDKKPSTSMAASANSGSTSSSSSSSDSSGYGSTSTSGSDSQYGSSGSTSESSTSTSSSATSY